MPDYSTIQLHPNSYLPSQLKDTTYDVICIGSGWSASTLAGRMTKAGLTTIMVEAELFGGDCPFWACVPSKALLRPGDALAEVKAVKGAAERLHSAKEGPAPEGVFGRRDEWTAKWNDETVVLAKYKTLGAAFVRGRGTLVGEKKVHVEGANGDSITLEARHAVLICTGSTATIPSTPGLKEAKPWTPRQATSSSTVPEHLIVMGTGAVGCEMADLYANLGGKVTILSRGSGLLSKVDPEAGKIVQERLKQQGVNVVNNVKTTRVTRGADGKVKVETEGNGTIEGTEILVAAGRKPNIANLGLEQFGVDTSGKALATDDSLCVTAASGNWLYAGGDVNGRSPLSHGAKYHGRVIANAILARIRDPGHQATPWGRAAATADHHAVPQVVFTRPNVASVGLTRESAKKQGVKFREITAPVKTLGAGLRADGYEDGWAQWIVEADTETLLGATFVGDDAADLLHASTVAVVGGLTVAQLSHAVPAFPTMSEVYLNLIEAAGY